MVERTQPQDARWAAVDRYIGERLLGADEAPGATLAANAAGGLPDIDVSPAQGKLLQLLALIRGARRVLEVAELGYTYRHSDLPEGAVVVSATFRGVPGESEAIQAEMDRIAASREASQPLRSKTGGSTFKNPPGEKAWALVDAAGCRGLRRGDAQVSEKHTNFLLNLGNATSADIEGLGEDVRARVKAASGVTLEWEIQRVGVAS